MIYSKTISYVRCDKCGEELETNAATNEIANETAKRNGWFILNELDWLKERHYCPECAKKL